jgi:uncharacterized protein (DUF58 family)
VTGNGVVVLLVGLGGLGIWYAGYPGAAYVAIPAGLLLVPALAWRLFWSRAAAIRLHVPARVGRGEPAGVTLDVPAGRGAVHVSADVLGGRTDWVVRAPSRDPVGWDVVPLRRGLFHSRLTRAELLGPWGLTTRRLVLGEPVETLVLPRRHPLDPPPPATQVDEDGPMGTRRGGAIFAGLREYEPGDDPRLVDAAASARTADGSLLVRQYVLARTAGYRVMLDPDLGNSRWKDFETAVDLAYSVACAIHASRQLLALSTVADGDPVHTTTVADTERVLATVQPCRRDHAGSGGCVQALATRTRNLTVTILVTANDRPVPATPRSSPTVVFRIGPARPMRRTHAVTTFDTPDLAAAARAWNWLGRR